MAAPTDTLLASQWALGTASGKDIEVRPVWTEFRGSGIKVAVIDDGFDYNHADLRANYALALDRDLRTGDADAMADVGDNHGTAVMGVIGADDNGTGTVGVAPDATLIGLRIGYGANGSASQIVAALNAGATADVVNNSWGYSTFFSDNFDAGMSSAEAAIIGGVSAGRGGLGTNYVFAAGNNRVAGDNTNHHNFTNSIHTTAVASTDVNGVVASSSTPGASVHVSAPGVGILSTDITGSAGWSSGDQVTVSGTSFAAPAVSGVIALMLDANAALGYRDVQEILAYSAVVTDPTRTTWQVNHAANWNGGGLHSSTDYGFGLVNAHDAVRLAETWGGQSTYATLDVATNTAAPGIAVPDGVAGGVASGLNITRALNVDKVEVELSLQHTYVGDLRVSLISPTGTASILIDRPGNGASSSDNIVFSLVSNQFWGESSVGTWTLRVEDLRGTEVGTLGSWRLNVYGDDVTGNDRYVYTDEYGTYAQGTAARRVLADAAGDDTLNASALTTDALIDLRSGAASIIAGQQLTIGATTKIERAFAGDGNDLVTGNELANWIWGGRGNDVLSGEAGDDRFVYGIHSGSDAITDFGGNDKVVLTAGVRVASLVTTVATLNDGTTITATNGRVWSDVDFLFV